jgi:hypothetical protein
MYVYYHVITSPDARLSYADRVTAHTFYYHQLSLLYDTKSVSFLYHIKDDSGFKTGRISTREQLWPAPFFVFLIIDGLNFFILCSRSYITPWIDLREQQIDIDIEVEEIFQVITQKLQCSRCYS